MKNEKVKITLLILGLVLLFLFFLLWRQYVYFQKMQAIAAFRGNISQETGLIASLRRHGPLTAADTSYIQGWMTFDYVDTTFDVPSSYLKNALVIENPQYPRVSIARYAREKNLDPTTFTSEVAAAVRAYIASSSPTASVQ